VVRPERFELPTLWFEATRQPHTLWAPILIGYYESASWGKVGFRYYAQL
jgi:hypothetical protein